MRRVLVGSCEADAGVYHTPIPAAPGERASRVSTARFSSRKGDLQMRLFERVRFPDASGAVVRVFGGCCETERTIESATEGATSTSNKSRPPAAALLPPVATSKQSKAIEKRHPLSLLPRGKRQTDSARHFMQFCTAILLSKTVYQRPLSHSNSSTANGFLVRSGNRFYFLHVVNSIRFSRLHRDYHSSGSRPLHGCIDLRTNKTEKGCLIYF